MPNQLDEVIEGLSTMEDGTASHNGAYLEREIPFRLLCCVPQWLDMKAGLSVMFLAQLERLFRRMSLDIMYEVSISLHRSIAALPSGTRQEILPHVRSQFDA